MLWQKILKWLAGIFGQELIDYAFPQAKAEREAALAHKDAQAVKDAQVDAEIAVITGRQAERDKVIAEDDVAIIKGREDLAVKNKQIEGAGNDPDQVKAIEDVWKMKT